MFINLMTNTIGTSVHRNNILNKYYVYLLDHHYITEMTCIFCNIKFQYKYQCIQTPHWTYKHTNNRSRTNRIDTKSSSVSRGRCWRQSYEVVKRSKPSAAVSRNAVRTRLADTELGTNMIPRKGQLNSKLVHRYHGGDHKPPSWGKPKLLTFFC